MNQLNPLAKISNQDLELRLKDLASKERKLLHVILEHIKELETRKLYLARAYSSAFEYLVKELGYSNSAAMRRLEAARLLKAVPVVAQKIQEGAINLSQIGELSRALKEKEKISGAKITNAVKAELVSVISGKTAQETQKELALVLDIPVREFEKQKIQQDESLRLEITLTRDQLEKFRQCKDLAAHLLMQNYNSDNTWGALFEVLADQFLAKRKKGSEKNLLSENISHVAIVSAGEFVRTQSNFVEVNSEMKIVEKAKMNSMFNQDNDTETNTNTNTYPNLNSNYNSNSNSNSTSNSNFNSNSNSNSNFKPKPKSKSKSNFNVSPNANLSLKSNLNASNNSNSNSFLKSTSYGAQLIQSSNIEILCSKTITDAAIGKSDYKNMTPLLKQKILYRDKCCQFIDPLTGRKCGSTFQLEVDHKTSQWAGGVHSVANLQALCRQHNNYKYQIESGVRNL